MMNISVDLTSHTMESKEERLKKQFVDESYRMDDNANLSEIARKENQDLNDDLIPGIGSEE